MKKSYIVGGILAVAIAAVLGFVFLGNQSGTRSIPPAAPTPITQTQPTASPVVPSSAAVTYTDSGFSPSIVTIQKGGTAVFKNTASDAVRVSSNPHPIHNGYPTTGGCAGSTFDSCSNIAPGGSWSFTFTFAGKWGYHNHLNPSEGGTVIVK